MDVDKKKLRIEFGKEWEKHYKLPVLMERGFSRRKCSKCGRMFWSIEERDVCGDSACIGYQFIGETPVKKKLNYIQTWKKIKKYFTSHGHGYVTPFPTVARWRDDLYFTIASISDFQPYVVNGELEPPFNPLIVPQPCIRFPDIGNVGITGRHFTNFVMIGQHAFNTKKTGLFYWKDEAILHDINYVKALGIPEKEMVFQEDVWAGGGNFGPSMEYFVKGLELGNCVFMQYEVTPSGYRELDTKVIDMGSGLERFAWITSGDLTSYEVVFGPVIERMKKDAAVSIEKGLFERYAKIAASLDEDEVDDIEAEKERVAELLGITKKELFESIEPLQALYATADHLKTILFAVTDGMLPSNAGGGYNLRMLLRRVFGFKGRYDYGIDYSKVIEEHADHLEPLFPHLKQGVGTTIDVVSEEEKRYRATKEKARTIVINLMKKAKGTKKATNKETEGFGSIGPEQLFLLYKSHGIPPEHIAEVGEENGVAVKVPGNFYAQIRESEGEEVVAEGPPKKVLGSDVARLPKTEALYYTAAGEFDAKVLAVVAGKYVVLSRSAFYPEGGGQVSDTGTIDGIKVKHVIRIAGVMLHEVEKPDDFNEGKKVKGNVDLERRMAIARHHSATHLVNAACREILGDHIWQAGAYKDEEKGHLDVTHYKRIKNDELSRIEEKVNGYIMQDLPITTVILPRNVAEGKYGFRLYQGGAVPGKELRVVNIGDVDIEACGGTHQMLKSTGMIGAFKIVKRESIQDGVERIVFKTGTAAVKYMQERDAIISSSASIVSVSDSELPRTVERFFNEWKAQRKKIEWLSKALVKAEAFEIINESKKGKPVIRFVDLDVGLLRNLALGVLADDKASAVLINQKGDVVCVAGPSSGQSAKALLDKVIEQLGGSGGGSDKIASGKVEKVAKISLE